MNNNNHKLRELVIRIKVERYSGILLVLLAGLPVLSSICGVIGDVAGAVAALMYSLLADVCLVLACILLIQRRLKKQKYNRIEWTGALFLGWALVCTLCASDPLWSFYGAEYRMEGYLGMLLYAAIFVLAGTLSELWISRLCLVFVASSILPAVLFWIQKAGYQGLVFFSMGAVNASVFQHHNHYGYYLTMVVLCAAVSYVQDASFSQKNSGRKYFFLLSYLINVVTLAGNDTMGAILAVFVSLVFLYVNTGFRKGDWKRCLFVCALFILVFCGYNAVTGSMNENVSSLVSDIGKLQTRENVDSIGTGRGKLWRAAIKYIQEKPLTGYGPDGLGECYQKDGFKQDRPANEYLQYAGFYGIPGLVLYLIWIILIGLPKQVNIRFIKDEELMALICVMGYLCSGFFGNTVYNTTCYFFLFLGLLARESSQKTLRHGGNYVI